MTFDFHLELANQYHNKSQKSRVITEDWVERNVYCPVCGNTSINRYKNNHPAGDFYCEVCNSDFELKSIKSNSGKLAKTIPDGAYSTMISRITSLRNPNFFFMTYKNDAVDNLIIIPNHFFTPQIIIKRNPLSSHARRKGWTGCTIDISAIPEFGKIFIVKNQNEIDHQLVVAHYARINSLRTKNMNNRGWLLDTLNCVERISSKEFTLQQLYSFETELKKKHPENNFIKEKIRQQLQFLREKGIIEFITPGCYRKI